MNDHKGGDTAAIPAYGVKNITESPWYCGPGHTPNALSKQLVGPNDGSRKIGYVISCYAPGHGIAPHKHDIRDQVYHILEGEGIMVIDGKRYRVGKNDIAFFPAGVEHGLYNEGTTNLVFVIANSPPTD
jgi:mannose-6-phosphate isomerase-like protein (cupin superfamily)